MSVWEINYFLLRNIRYGHEIASSKSRFLINFVLNQCFRWFYVFMVTISISTVWREKNKLFWLWVQWELKWTRRNRRQLSSYVLWRTKYRVIQTTLFEIQFATLCDCMCVFEFRASIMNTGTHNHTHKYFTTPTKEQNGKKIKTLALSLWHTHIHKTSNSY